MTPFMIVMCMRVRAQNILVKMHNWHRYNYKDAQIDTIFEYRKAVRMQHTILRDTYAIASMEYAVNDSRYD